MCHSKHKPYLTTTDTTTTTTTEENDTNPSTNNKLSSSPTNTAETTAEEKKLEMSLAKQSADKQWNLLGPYLGQYIVYTGESHAWLLT